MLERYKRTQEKQGMKKIRFETNGVLGEPVNVYEVGDEYTTPSGTFVVTEVAENTGAWYSSKLKGTITQTGYEGTKYEYEEGKKAFNYPNEMATDYLVKQYLI